MATYNLQDYDVYAHHARHLIQARHEQIIPFATSPGIPDLLSRAEKGDAPLKACPQHSDVIPVAVGILGAGAGGLYTALMLDSLGIPYEILESSQRTGGRLFTHKFSDAEFDYYDVGAMRFPKVKMMKRLFNLFAYPPLNPKGNRLEDKLIPYYYYTASYYQRNPAKDNGFLYFNGRRGRDVRDISQKNSFLSAAVLPNLPPQASAQYIAAGARNIAEDVYKPFVDRLVRDLETGGSEGWHYMQSFDKYSTRAYMSVTYKPSPSLNIPEQPLPNNVVNWCETFDKSSGWYDRGLTESILEGMAFGAGAEQVVEWHCLKGGAQVLSNYMEEYIRQRKKNAIAFDKHVTAIAQTERLGKPVMKVKVAGETEPRTYGSVISTLPLPVLRTLDLKDCDLMPMQTNALRELDYGPSIKVGIKFKSQWWTEKFNIVGGQSFTDRPIRTIVYPSYGTSKPPLTTVLIASYCWTYDAERTGALIATGEKYYDAQLKALVLRDLADVHRIDVCRLEEEFVEIFSWDWNHDPRTMGAFAFFGPGKFVDLYDSLTVPAGNLYFAGEALSTRHAWVVGALDSAWVAVYIYLFRHHWTLIPKFQQIWGSNPDWITPGPRFDPTRAPPTDAVHDLLLKHLVLRRPELFEA
jgi:monoamine oxidase